MKKLIIAVLIVLILSGCIVQESTVALPNLEGKTETEIVDTLDNVGLFATFIVKHNVVLEQSKQFIEYGQNLNIGDLIGIGTYVPVIISQELIDNTEYFVPIELDYDGPNFNEMWLEWPAYQAMEDGSFRGTGGAFYVTYEPGYWRDRTGGCIDGDTTVFEYPETIREKIQSNTPSTRYFNIDTMETYPGGEEAFGQPATQYVCSLLALAESIILQTDPGDNLTDRYGRFLAWIWVRFSEEDPYQLLNYRVVRQGLGEVKYLFGAGETEVTVDQGLTFTEWMFLAESRAIEAQLGMHGDLLDYYWDYENNVPHPTRWP